MEGGIGRDHPDEIELARYVEYLRHETKGIPAGLREHVESCSHCRSEIMAIADLMDKLPEVGESVIPGLGQTPAGFLRSGARRFLTAAAAVAAVVAISWGLRTLLHDREEAPQVAVKNTQEPAVNPIVAGDTVRKEAAKEIKPAVAVVVPDTVRFAEAFVPNSTYENLITAKYRAGSDPRVTGPGPSVIFRKGDTLRLAWTRDPADEYEIVILDNRERRVGGFMADTSGRADWVVDLAPGLYYWKFLGKEELWKVGRFRVMKDFRH